MKRGFTLLAIVTSALLALGLYKALALPNWPFGTPTEQTMGYVQRIFYYHVPSAWTALALFLVNLLASIRYLIGANGVADRVTGRAVIVLALAVCLFPVIVGHNLLDRLGIQPSAFATTGIVLAGAYFLIRRYFPGNAADVLALATAELGVVFCAVVLVTGPIWARPVWGIWWDPADIRLNSTLALWLIYVSYLVLRRFSTSSKTATIAAVWAIFGALDVPFVFFSIWFFRTQHPSPVIAQGGYLDPHMWVAVLINWAAFLCLAWLVCWTRYRLEVLKREVDEAQALESLHEVSR